MAAAVAVWLVSAAAQLLEAGSWGAVERVLEAALPKAVFVGFALEAALPV